MTLEQLKAVEGLVKMCESHEFRTLMAYLRDECPYVGQEQLSETNALLRNEGCLQGWLRCVRIASNIHRSKPKPEPSQGKQPIYPDPTKSDDNAPKTK